MHTLVGQPHDFYPGVDVPESQRIADATRSDYDPRFGNGGQGPDIVIRDIVSARIDG